jgi:hypothetical protein
VSAGVFQLYVASLLLGKLKKKLLVGSNANNSGNAGLSNFNSNNTVSNSNTNISFQSVSSFMSFSQKFIVKKNIMVTTLASV